MNWQDDFTYYYLDENGNIATASSCSGVPESVDEFCKLHEAVSYVQHLGCLPGTSQHRVDCSFHQLCLEVLKIGVQKHGQVFPVVLRGIRDDRPDDDHRILFGTRDREVAEFYGTVREYRDVKGLPTRSHMASVKTGEIGDCDEEIIFFP